MRHGSYPHSAFRKEFTVSTVGEDAVKYFGFAAGNGSALGVWPISCNCNGPVGFCAAAGGAGAAPVPVRAPANPVTPRPVANTANIQFEIFKESILRCRQLRAAPLLHLNLDRNGNPAPHSERLFRHFQHWRRLLPLILAPLYKL